MKKKQKSDKQKKRESLIPNVDQNLSINKNTESSSKEDISDLLTKLLKLKASLQKVDF